MADFQTLLDNVALVLGGTAPDSVSRPGYFSGAEVGDGTELGHGTAAPLKFCWSIAPTSIQDTPGALVMPGSFEISGPERPDVLVLGEEWNVDVLRLQVFMALVDHRTDWPLLNPYRDLIPAAFRANMQLKGTANVLTAMVRSGRAVELEYAGTHYIGWECQLHVQRVLQATYTA